MRVYIALGISLGIGLLIGLQRERTEPRLGGIRTFPLLALLGTLCGLLAEPFGSWTVGAGFLAVLGVLALSNLRPNRGEDTEHGQTTEVAALLTFALGAYVVEGKLPIAILVSGILVVLLHTKRPLHRFVQKMGARDMNAIMKFVVITLIILPLLPNRVYGPWKVLNPFDIWRMVVLIVGISLAGYVALKILGERTGAILGGILGGMVSSTATTVSYARRTKNAPGADKLGAFVVQTASTVAYVRVLVITAAIAPAQAGQTALPIAAMLLWMILLSSGAYLVLRDEKQAVPSPRNPAELKSAFVFGLIYAVVLLASAAVKQQFGSAGLYVVSGVSGLADMDAITVSISRQMGGHGIEPNEAWRMILIASLANLVFKGGAAALLGGRRFALIVALLSVVGIAGGLAILWLWPTME
jgi:uncharacterized membrane protein (DUF4010 family)